MPYKVKLTNLEEKTYDIWEYSDLLDALTVIKNAPIEEHSNVPNMTSEKFEKSIHNLLAGHAIYVGVESEFFPQGNKTWTLWKV